MAAIDYEAKRKEFDNVTKLLGLWKKVSKTKTKTLKADGWDRGKALEFLVLRGFELEGAEIRWPFTATSINEQIDGAIHVAGLSCLLECKDYKQSINVEPLAKLRNQLLRRPAHTIGIVVSRNGFTDPAKTLAQFMAPHAMLLWDGSEFSYALESNLLVRGLTLKHRRCIEEGMPDFYLNNLTLT